MPAFLGRTKLTRDLVMRIATAIGALLASAGCSSHGSMAPGTGSLTVTITAPPGVSPSVTVSGPGFQNGVQFTATGTLTGIVPGSYTVNATTEPGPGLVVSTVYPGNISGSPAVVTANDTAKVSVTYTPQAGSGGLWVANSAAPEGLDRYSAAQLSSSTDAAPTTSLGTGDPSPFGVAYYGGNLWVALGHANAVVKYTASQLALSDLTVAPNFALGANGGSLNQPTALAFDGLGDLWVANAGANTVVEFSASQLVSGLSRGGLHGVTNVTPIPAVTITAAAGSLDAPLAIAFDYNDNLWVANANAGTVVEFVLAQLALNGAPTPTVTLSSTAGSIVGPMGMAFDSAGDLWVANGNTGHNTVVEFTTSQLTTSGSPTPNVVLTANAGSLASPAGLAFDNSHNLWVANTASPTVVEFTPSQLASSGNPAPSVVVKTRATSLGLPVGIAFDPYPLRLPMGNQCVLLNPWDYC